MTEDRWKIIPDTENKYEVSTRGRIRRVFLMRDGSVRCKRELHPVPCNHVVRVWIKRNGKPAYYTLSRLVAEAFIPNFDLFDLSVKVVHKDGNIKNNYLENLETAKR